MDRILAAFVVVALMASLLGVLGGQISLTGLFVGFGQPEPQFGWWNISWHYRMKLNVSSGAYDRTDWVFERDFNFTDQLPSGTFDNNSIRVVEYDPSTGGVLGEVTSQFDEADSYSASNNAVGTLSFVMNGTTPSGSTRTFFVYYDKTENGAKQSPSYPTSLVYGVQGTEFSVNNSLMYFRVDTSRGDGTSGLVRVRALASQNDIFPEPLAGGDRTYEYMQYSNGTNNFTFNFANSARLKYSGPVRMVVQESGNEVFWNTATNTSELSATKSYVFYDGLPWIRVETNVTDSSPNPVTRNSTFAGAIQLDAARIFGSNWQSVFGNTTQPGWWFASDQFASFHAGIIQVNQTGTSNYWVPNSSSDTVIGVQLNTTTISPGASILEDAVMHFNDTTGDPNLVRNLRDRLASQVTFTQSMPQEEFVVISPATNASTYNRNETVEILVNLSSGDPYNLTGKVNATFDLGTVSQADDQTIPLFDDGTNGDSVPNDRVFTADFATTSSSAQGTWSVNVTAYSNASEVLNYTSRNFTVTDVLLVSPTVVNVKPIVGTQVSAFVNVNNFRNDSYIISPVLGCNVLGLDVTNETDLGNGTISINFTAPSQPGTYTLYCNATSNGNFGTGNATFGAEVAKTNVSITPAPFSPTAQGVTSTTNGSFAVSGNVSNVGNGTAHSANVTLQLLDGWLSNSSIEVCGDITTASYCVEGFNVSVPAGTSPGYYVMNMSANWTNPDGSAGYNQTQINVSVQNTPVINVSESSVSGEAGDGTWTVVGNFTVVSQGNGPLQNVSFSCSSGTVCSSFSVNYTPTLISDIAVGSNASVSLNVTVPLSFGPGTYNGTINASAQNDGFDTFVLYVTLPAKTNVTVNNSISNYTANTVTQQTSESFQFSSTATDVLNGSARASNISVAMPPGWSANSSAELCGDLVRGSSCVRGFTVTIPVGTPPGSYLVNATANWTDPDGAMGRNFSPINVSVVSNPTINVSEVGVSGVLTDGSRNATGNFTVMSVGNGALLNVSYSCYTGTVCQNFTVVFTPSVTSTVAAGTNASVGVNISAPLGFPSGTYTGTINASAQNDGYDTLNITVLVLENRTWTMSPTSCTVPQQLPTGTACLVNVTNIGNTLTNFTVSPSQGNYTAPNETFFSLNRSSWHQFNITYNTTGQPPGVYNTSFVITPSPSPSSPSIGTVNISLIPFAPPIMNLTISPAYTTQGGGVTIYANVTDQSGTGISSTRVNVTRPNGTLDSASMYETATNGTLTQWQLSYPNGTFGNTTSRGNYSVTVYSSDNLGNTENANSSFVINQNITVVSSTQSNIYYQGDQGSIFYLARNLSGQPLVNVTANFTIRDNLGNLTYSSSNYQTNADGTITPLPTFLVPSDAPLGNYTLTSSTSYFDSVTNNTVSFQSTGTFQVLAKTVSVSGLFADFTSSIIWYPSNVMKFGILTYNGQGQPVSPDSINLTIYDPAGAVYKTATISDMTNTTKGFFNYQFAMPAGTAEGMYLGYIDVRQGGFETQKLTAFRVSQGGPFDFRLFLQQPEVSPGQDLPFSINVENKGDVSQDVFIEYWVTQDNVTYSQFSEAVLAPGLSNQTFTRSIHMFTTQPLGTYYLNARMTHSSVESPIQVNKTFILISAASNSTTPAPATGASGGGASTVVNTVTTTGPVQSQIPAGILISRYNNNITLARGVTKIENVVVTNIGTTSLSNVSLFMLGLTPSWFTVTPSNYATLSPGNSSVFLITFIIPNNAAVGEYPVNLLASSGVVSDQKRITVSVLQSIDELIREDIQKLRDELQTIEVEARVGAIQGKDVSAVNLIIDQIKVQIDNADTSLGLGRSQDAIDSIQAANNLIDKANEELAKLEIKNVPSFLVPWDVVIPVAGAGGGVGLILFFLWRKKKLPTGIRPWMMNVAKAAESMRSKKPAAAGPADDTREMDRLMKMLEVLEKERDERIISLGAYNEMKKSIEKKLAKFDKK